MKFIPIITRSFVALIAIGVLAACQPAEEQQKTIVRPIKAMKIGSAEKIVGKNFPGVAKATQEVDLSFRVSGTLEKMPVKIGQEVRIGDILAVLDQRDFEVEAANARAGLANAKAQLKNAKTEYERVLRIQKSDPGAVSQSTIDLRQTTFEQAEATHASSEALLNAAEDKLSYATLKAPFDGVVVQRFVDNFQDINTSSTIFRLVDMSKIEMDVSIPENLIANLPYVQNIRVTFDAFPNVTIPAKIKEVSNEASQSTRTFQVRIIMEPPVGIDILPGMSGNATGDVIRATDGNQPVIVPLKSIFSSTDAKTTYVWMFNHESRTVTKREVQKGNLIDQGVTITQGLKSGDWIATAGVHFLTEGQKVRLLESEGK